MLSDLLAGPGLLLVGIALGYVLARVGNRPPQRVEPPHAESEPDTPGTNAGASDETDEESASIYDVAQRLSPFFQRSAHPVDLLDSKDFQRGLALLADPAVTVDKLLSYAGGGNVPIASMALEALHRRPALDADTVDRTLDLVEQTYIWPMQFLLRVLHDHADRPMIGAVLARAREWWESESVMVQILQGFVDARRTAGEEPAFGDELQVASEDGLDHVEAVLLKLRGDAVEPLLRELEAWRRTRVDVKLLQGIGRVWTMEDTDGVVELRDQRLRVEALEASLVHAPHRSVLLVGPAGVGKTAVIRLLARRMMGKGWTVFEAGAVDLLAGQVFIGELEKRIQQVVRALGGGRRVLWVAPAFHELLFAGRHRHNITGVLDMLLPHIEDGTLRVVGETRPEAFERIIRQRPGVRTALDVHRLPPLEADATLDLARAWHAAFPETHPPLGPGTLEEAFHLAQQYLGDRAAPGHLLELLRLTYRRIETAGGRDEGVTVDDLLETLSGLTGLPRSILDDRRGLDLEHLEQHFSGRVLGQPEAVACLTERVAMIKAGLTDPTRPFGVFLFVGPTGTGKTEIAKTLAEFLFGSPERMIRLDMSEFQTAESLDRLLGEQDETSGQTALVNQIRRQPFSVVLLDEFEKAHRNVWDVFLQVFDDGRLTDRRGTTADFRHSIIILTSNVGTAAQRARIGFRGERVEVTAGQVERAVRESFRPEFVNRIDRVVAFRPLSRSVMRGILHKELGDVLHRRGLRNRQWAVEWEDSAINFLLDEGFTEDLGARPLKRAVERHLLAPLARTIVTHQFPEGDQFLFVRSDGDRLQVEFIDPDATDEAREVPAGGESEEPKLVELALDPHGTVRELAFLKDAYETLAAALDDEAWVRRKEADLARMADPGFWDAPDRFRALGEAEYMDRIEAGLRTAGRWIERLEGAGGRPRDHISSELVRRLAEQLYLVDAAYRGFLREAPRDAYVCVEARPDGDEDRALAFAEEVASMYRSWAKKRRMQFETLEEQAGEGGYACVLAVSGFGAYVLLEPEAGLHVLETPGQSRGFDRDRVVVRVAAQPEEAPGEGESKLARARAALRDAGPPPATVVRRYRREPSPLVRDSVRGWRTGRVDRVLDGDFDLLT